MGKIFHKSMKLPKLQLPIITRTTLQQPLAYLPFKAYKMVFRRGGIHSGKGRRDGLRDQRMA